MLRCATELAAQAEEIENESRASVTEVGRAGDASHGDQRIEERAYDGLLLSEDAIDREGERIFASAPHDERLRDTAARGARGQAERACEVDDRDGLAAAREEARCAPGGARPPGTPLTWGEAFLAALFIFALLLMIYGVVPDRWLRWADGDLKWRSDKVGIPVGGIGIARWHLFHKPYLLWPKGISFAAHSRGKVKITAQVLRDIIATVIYGIGLVGQIVMWLWWQRRGKKAAGERPALTTSAYGRPLVRQT